MAQLTQHFADTELGVDAPQLRSLLPADQARIVSNATQLCIRILEPTRAHYNLPVDMHCGYRPPAHNAKVGGKPNSFHLYNGDEAAGDWGIPTIPYAEIFDWVRLKSGLPFDEVIIETIEELPILATAQAYLDWVRSTATAACIHTQIHAQQPNRRIALIGQTGAGLLYIPVPVN
jgi:hypothetical protein